MINGHSRRDFTQLRVTSYKSKIENLGVYPVFQRPRSMQLTKTFHSLHFFIELPVRTENPVGLPTLEMEFQHLVLNHDNVLFNHINRTFAKLAGKPG